jgi:hypothetical protein
VPRWDAATPPRFIVLRGVRARPNGTFYAEIRIGGFCHALGTYDTLELAVRAYNAATWLFWCPQCDLNFREVESLAEVEFLTPPSRLIND